MQEEQFSVAEVVYEWMGTFKRQASVLILQPLIITREGGSTYPGQNQH
jgi:hypothetical protein